MAAKALRVLLLEHDDVAIADILQHSPQSCGALVMPGMSGGELARQLRRQRTGLRVLFMSGYSNEAVATHGALSPGSVFLQKPFTVEDPVARLREVLDRAEA